MLDFELIQNCLDKLPALTDASEAHGTLCGLLVGRQDYNRWLECSLEQIPDKSDLLAAERLSVLRDLFEESKVQLNTEDMSLEILLPEEDHEFAERLVGLASWCSGFLYGLGTAGESILEPLSEQGRECLDDLLQISQLGHDEDENDETEMVYSELVEHVRLSVIYMNEEINPVISSPLVH